MAQTPPQKALTVVIFGGTGDLARRKLIPALFSNYRAGRLRPGLRIVGFAGSERTEDNYREHLRAGFLELAPAGFDQEIWGDFARNIWYTSGQFTDDTAFARLCELLAIVEGGPADRLYYLATAPEHYALVVGELGAAGMAKQSDEAWRRIVIEKPFGDDLASAQALNRAVQAGRHPDVVGEVAAASGWDDPQHRACARCFSRHQAVHHLIRGAIASDGHDHAEAVPRGLLGQLSRVPGPLCAHQIELEAGVFQKLPQLGLNLRPGALAGGRVQDDLGFLHALLSGVIA